MTYKGIVKNGVVVLDGAVELHDGTVVRVEPVVTSNGEGGRTIYERLDALAGTARDLPGDLARRHDRYLHGRADT